MSISRMDHEKSITTAAPHWVKCYTDAGLPFYACATLRRTSWLHPRLATLLVSITRRLSDVRHSVYRMALKCRRLQMSLLFDTVPAVDVERALSCMPAVDQMHASLLEASCQRLVSARARADMLVSLILSVLDFNELGEVSVRAVRVLLLLLCGGPLLHRYHLIVRQLADNNASDKHCCVSQADLCLLLQISARLAELVDETGTMGSWMEADTLTSCQLSSAAHFHYSQRRVLAWINSEPLVLAWLSTLYRINVSRRVTHRRVTCSVCGARRVRGLCFTCVRCVGFWLCENCFLYARTTSTSGSSTDNKRLIHGCSHSLREFCVESRWSQRMALMLERLVCGSCVSACGTNMRSVSAHSSGNVEQRRCIDPTSGVTRRPQRSDYQEDAGCEQLNSLPVRVQQAVRLVSAAECRATWLHTQLADRYQLRRQVSVIQRHMNDAARLLTATTLGERLRCSSSCSSSSPPPLPLHSTPVCAAVPAFTMLSPPAVVNNTPSPRQYGRLSPGQVSYHTPDLLTFSMHCAPVSHVSLSQLTAQEDDTCRHVEEVAARGTCDGETAAVLAERLNGAVQTSCSLVAHTCSHHLCRLSRLVDRPTEQWGSVLPCPSFPVDHSEIESEPQQRHRPLSEKIARDLADLLTQLSSFCVANEVARD